MHLKRHGGPAVERRYWRTVRRRSAARHPAATSASVAGVVRGPGGYGAAAARGPGGYGGAAAWEPYGGAAITRLPEGTRTYRWHDNDYYFNVYPAHRVLLRRRARRLRPGCHQQLHILLRRRCVLPDGRAGRQEGVRRGRGAEAGGHGRRRRDGPVRRAQEVLRLPGRAKAVQRLRQRHGPTTFLRRGPRSRNPAGGNSP